MVVGALPATPAGTLLVHESEGLTPSVEEVLGVGAAMCHSPSRKAMMLPVPKMEYGGFVTVR